MAARIALIMCFVVLCGHGVQSMLHTERKLPNKIKGPKCYHDKIAIVGAGPSGIHMAYLLKQRGFTNVHILEKSSRIGGKVYTKHHRNTALNMGAILIAEDFAYVMELAKKFLPNELHRMPRRAVWYNDKQMTVTEFVINYIREKIGGIYKNMDDESILAEYAKAADRYNKLHVEIFGRFEGYIFPKPKNMDLIRGTFEEFLQRNNLTILHPFFLFVRETFGYSYQTIAPAFYWLFVKFLLPTPEDSTKPTSSFLKGGYQKLWEVIVEKEGLDVAFNIDIQKVYREYEGDHSKVWLYLARGEKQSKWEEFDFLIWSPEMEISMDRWMNNILDERKLLGKTIPTHYRVCIVDSKDEQHGFTPMNIVGDNMDVTGDGKVNMYGDMYSIIRKYSGSKYENSQYAMGEDGKKVTTYITYQQNIPKRSTRDLNQLLNNHFRSISASSVKIVYCKYWRYFPRHSVEDIDNGVFWKIIDIQGKYGMWYIGSSVFFETVDSVSGYNAFLVQNMEIPPGDC